MPNKSLPIEMFNYIMSFVPPSPVLNIINNIHNEWNNENIFNKKYAKRYNEKYREISFYKYYFKKNRIQELQRKRDAIIKNDEFKLKTIEPMYISVRWHYLMRLEHKRLNKKIEEMNIKSYNCKTVFKGYIDKDAIKENKPHRKNLYCYHNDIEIDF